MPRKSTQKKQEKKTTPKKVADKKAPVKKSANKKIVKKYEEAQFLASIKPYSLKKNEKYMNAKQKNHFMSILDLSLIHI